MKTITQEQIKWLRSLKQKKFRTADNCYFVEGKKMLEEALTFASENIEFIVTTDDDFKISVTDKIEVLKCTEKQMNQFSELKTPLNKLMRL
ncbi:MAG: hypothetical protein ACKN86_11275 [Crocinitomicaceae bacterium]